jgi:hypothetical protein
LGYIMKDEGWKKFKIEKWGISRHPKPTPKEKNREG